VARYQYSVADIIGVQTPGNLSYFEDWKKTGKKLVVLQNWLADTKPDSCSISINRTTLAGRKIFVYAGNMGVAQGMDILIDLAEKLKDRRDIGFLFVGRGSEAKRLAENLEGLWITSNSRMKFILMRFLHFMSNASQVLFLWIRDINPTTFREISFLYAKRHSRSGKHKPWQ
jgi:glycosyltransferase involved in cell wall biosynthesis